MRIDWYTKGVLTVIALLLGATVARDYVGPKSAWAAGPFDGVQFTGHPNSFFDTRTGEVWQYDALTGGTGHYRATQLGAPFINMQ